MTYDPDTTPIHGTPIVSADPQPAQVRPGHHAPHVEGGTLPEVMPGEMPGIPLWIQAVIEKCRAHFRVCRKPYSDLNWTHLRPEAKQVRSYLEALLHLDPERDDVALLLEEVRVWLGGRVV